MKIGLFYGTNTGVTEIVSEQLQEILEDNGFDVDLFDIANTPVSEMDPYDKIIIATPTWNDGELQDDWEEAMSDYEEYDFSGKTVAFVGLGDQEAYCDNYLDAIGVMARPVRKTGGKIVGRWPADGYRHTASLGQDDDGMWVGLALDNDNEEELTEERMNTWVAQIKKEMS
ncbi:MAG: flavodoxin FldA [Candidatus Kapaibacteriales bacterium]